MKNRKPNISKIPKRQNSFFNLNWSFLKKGNFKPTSITANIEKTCFLNFQIKHYYFKSGRFDRFLINLLKKSKPTIKQGMLRGGTYMIQEDLQKNRQNNREMPAQKNF